MIAQKKIKIHQRPVEASLDYARLSTSEFVFDLTIVLKICLVQNGGMIPNPGVCQYYGDQSPSSDELLLEQVTGRHADYNGKIFMLEDWDTKEWRQFCNFYRDESILFWNNRFTLTSQQAITGSSFFSTKGSEYYRSTGKVATSLSPMNTVNCKFKLELTTSEAQAHKVINVYKISSLERTRAFRPDEEHYSADILKVNEFHIQDSDPILSQKFSYQRTFLHEVGHAIGLEHVGVVVKIPGCSQSENGSHICYGNTFETSMNVMGRGESLSWKESLPWCIALSKLTGTKVDSWLAAINPYTY